MKKLNYTLTSMFILVIAAICLYQIWRYSPSFPHYETGPFIGVTAGKHNVRVGKSFDDVPYTTGNNSTHLGVNDPNHTGIGLNGLSDTTTGKLCKWADGSLFADANEQICVGWHDITLLPDGSTFDPCDLIFIGSHTLNSNIKSGYNNIAIGIKYVPHPWCNQLYHRKEDPPYIWRYCGKTLAVDSKLFCRGHK